MENDALDREEGEVVRLGAAGSGGWISFLGYVRAVRLTQHRTALQAP
jgi:hypothetical protein